MNLYGLFILDVNIKYIVFSILYRHINVPMACKELSMCSCLDSWAYAHVVCKFYAGKINDMNGIFTCRAGQCCSNHWSMVVLRESVYK